MIHIFRNALYSINMCLINKSLSYWILLEIVLYWTFQKDPIGPRWRCPQECPWWAYVIFILTGLRHVKQLSPFYWCAPLYSGKNLYLKCTLSPFYCHQKMVRSTLGDPVHNCISSLEQILWTIGASLWVVAFSLMLTLHQVSAVDEADAEVDPPRHRSDAVLVQALSMSLGTSWPPVKFHMWLVQSHKKGHGFPFSRPVTSKSSSTMSTINPSQTQIAR